MEIDPATIPPYVAEGGVSRNGQGLDYRRRHKAAGFRESRRRQDITGGEGAEVDVPVQDLLPKGWRQSA